MVEITNKTIPKLAKEFRDKKRKEDPDSAFTKQIKQTNPKIEDVKKVVEEHFPEMWFYTEACLSVIATLKLKDLSNCVGLILQGAPSSTKTTLLSFFYGHPMFHKSDSFTPKSFVSHMNRSEAELQKIDLLPKIKHRVLLTPEMATVFGKRKEDLIESLSTLTRVLDGEGLETDSGSMGHRGYMGDYRFIWLGATTPIENKIWKVMGKLGARLFFLNVEQKRKLDSDLINDVIINPDYQKKVKKCRKIIHNFLNEIGLNKDNLFKINWNTKKDDEFCQNYIVRLVDLLKRLRAPLQIWSREQEDGYSYSTPIIEEPERAISILYSIARGHAILYDRDYLIKEDLPMVLKIASSSMPYDRAKIFNLLLEKAGVLEAEIISSKLICSIDTAHRIMKTLEILGLVDTEEYNVQREKGGRPLKRIVLKKRFRWILSE